MLLIIDSMIRVLKRKFDILDLDVQTDIFNNFSYENPKYKFNLKYNYSNWQTPKELYTFYSTDTCYYFSRGGLNKLVRILKQYDVQYRLINRTIEFKDLGTVLDTFKGLYSTTNDTCAIEYLNKLKIEYLKSKIDCKVQTPNLYSTVLKLWDNQVPPRDSILKYKQGAIEAPCSSGKTCIALDAIALSNQPAIILNYDTTHQKQWKKEILKFFKIPESLIGGCGGIYKKPKVGLINVCMVQSFRNKKIRNQFIPYCGFILTDEMHRYAAVTFDTVLHCFPARYRIGVTATKYRKDGLSFLLDDSIGGTIYKMTDKSKSRLEAKINLIKTPFTCFSFYKYKNNPKILNDMANSKVRNEIIINRTIQKVKQNKTVIILVERVKQALNLKIILDRHFPVNLLLIGKQNIKSYDKQYHEILNNFDPIEEYEKMKQHDETKTINTIIATQKGDTGFSLKTLDHLIITTPTGNNLKRFQQQKGRVERDYDLDLISKFGNKETPEVDYLWDYKFSYLRKAGENILENYKNVNILNYNP